MKTRLLCCSARALRTEEEVLALPSWLAASSASPSLGAAPAAAGGGRPVTSSRALSAKEWNICINRSGSGVSDERHHHCTYASGGLPRV